MPFFWFHVVWVIPMLILLGFFLLCARWGLWGWPRQYAAGPDPIEVLRDRFARGEIDQEEYERRRRVLEGR
jgi:putative membrane protein